MVPERLVGKRLGTLGAARRPSHPWAMVRQRRSRRRSGNMREALAFGHHCSSHELPADGRPRVSHHLILVCLNLTCSSEITASK